MRKRKRQGNLEQDNIYKEKDREWERDMYLHLLQGRVQPRLRAPDWIVIFSHLLSTSHYNLYQTSGHPPTGSNERSAATRLWKRPVWKIVSIRTVLLWSPSFQTSMNQQLPQLPPSLNFWRLIVLNLNRFSPLPSCSGLWDSSFAASKYSLAAWMIWSTRS